MTIAIICCSVTSRAGSASAQGTRRKNGIEDEEFHSINLDVCVCVFGFVFCVFSGLCFV